MDRDDLDLIVDIATFATTAHLLAKVARDGLGGITPGDVAWAAGLALVRSRLR